MGAWLVATAVATLIAWVAVSRVAEQVAAPAALPLPSPLIAVLESPEPAVEPVRPTPQELQESEQPPRPNPPAQEQTAAPPVAEPDPQPEPPTDEEAEQDPPEPRAITEGYRLTGGTVTVRYRNGDAELVQASPSSGFVMEINDPGPGKVDVRFRSEDHESRLVAQWRNGGPRPEREERER